MKYLDICVTTLLVLGALHLGVLGFFEFISIGGNLRGRSGTNSFDFCFGGSERFL